MAEGKTCKVNRFNVKLFFKDKQNCWITGMAVTTDGRILMVDFYNKKMKVFTKDMACLSHLPLSGEVRDVAVMSDKEAVVTMGCEQKLHILNIAEIVPSIQETIQLKIDVMGVTAHKDTFIVTCPNTVPPTVKKIHRSGKVLWSTSADESSNSFSDPWYICNNFDGSRIALSDRESHSVSLMDNETGDILKVRKLAGKHPRGLCMDKARNIYICYQSGVGKLTSDLSEESIVLSQETGMGGLPEAIAYDGTHEQLLISYSPLHTNCNSVDCFQLN